MANEFLTRSHEQVVGGLYRLGTVVGQSEDGAVYATEFGEDARPAVVKIRRGDTQKSERLLARWRDAIDLSHPNLIRVYAAGSAVMHDVPVVYVVMERAEESLAGVLAERALSEAETREMLAPTLGALKYLHENGYAHASLKSSNVLAVGDLLKLSSDSAMKMGNGGSPAEDMLALGGVIVQALTQQLPQMDGNPAPYILREASQPFTDIVRHCLDPDPEARWTVDQVEARLNAPVPAPIQAPPKPRAQKARTYQESRVQREKPVEDIPSRRTPRWIFGALAALVLIVFLVAVARKRDSGPVTVASNAAASREIPESTPPAPVIPTPEASQPTANQQPAAEANPASGAVDKKAGKREDGWSVIVGAYNFREPAEKRMQSMAAKWPKFNLSLYEQHADKVYYLVVIGQNISEDQAETLRKRAIAAGFPRDTYIKRLP